VVRSVQTVHLSCVKICTISIRTETSFHLSLITKEYHWMHPKWFLSLWYVWRKSCAYLALTLTLSTNAPKQDSTWSMSHRTSIECVQNNFWAYVTLSTKRCTNLASRLALSLNRPKRLSVEPHHLGVPSGVSKTISEPVVHLAQTVHKSCTKTNTVSKWTKTRFHMTHVTLEFYRVRPKRFMSLWYVQCKL
jgi:hypothetical protein